MRASGIRGDLDDFVQLHAVGVDPAFAARVKASGLRIRDADDLVELRALGTAAPAAPALRVQRIHMKMKHDKGSRDEGGNPDASPEANVDPDG
jgi:hypothetical protein